MSEFVLGLLVIVALALGWLALRSHRETPNATGERYRLSFEEAPIGMAVLKPSGEFLEVNKAMARLLGYDQGRLVGTNLTNLVHGDDQTDLGRAWEEMGNGTDHTATEWMRWLTVKGRPLWSRVSLSLVPWTPDQPAIVILQIEDASQSYDEQRRLQELIRGKDEFVAAVGDEIRTPLRLLIDLSSHPTESGDSLGEIEAHAREIAAILDDLVASARMSSTPVTVVAQHLDAGSLCRDVLAGLPHASDITTDFKATDMWADPTLTRQIVSGLLTNATRYGGPEVAIRAMASGPDIVIQVSDNGPEIPAEDRERLFDGDLRSGQRVTSPAAVGLSLTVGRHLARQMDGDLEYRRTPEGENLFELRLPTEPVTEVLRPRAVGASAQAPV